MFKNAKWLKGTALILAFVLALSFGVFMKISASSRYAVFYLSPYGDDSTGLDEASGFTSLKTATQALSQMRFLPDTDIYLMVTEDMELSDRILDDGIVCDTDGNPLTLTVQAYNLEETVQVDLTYTPANTLQAEASIRTANNYVFKNVDFVSRCYDMVGESAPRYMKAWYIDGADVTFDNCLFKNDRDYNTNKWLFIGTHYLEDTATRALAATPTLSFANMRQPDEIPSVGSNLTIYSQDTINPLFDVTVNITNTAIDTVYALADTNKSAQVHSVTINFFEGAYINKMRINGQGAYTVPGGVTINYGAGATVLATDAFNNSEVIINGDITHNFYDGFQGKNNFSLSTYGTLNGNVTNNFYGGTFGSYMLPGGRVGCFVNGTITNNYYGGTFNQIQYGTSFNGTYQSVVNNFYGGTFKQPVYGAGGHTDAVEGKEGRESVQSIENNIYGGTFNSSFYGGGNNSDIKGDVTTRVYGGTFNGRFLGACRGGIVNGTLTTVICGGTFDNAQYIDGNGGNDGLSGYVSPNAVLEIRPDDSDKTLTLNIRLRDCENLTKTLYGATKPIEIGQRTELHLDDFSGTTASVIQTKQWTGSGVSTAFITLPSTANTSVFNIYNNSGVTGTASWKLADGKRTLTGRATPSAPALPSLYGANFVLNDNIEVRFYVDAATVMAYVDEIGPWTCTLTYQDKVIDSQSFATSDLSGAVTDPSGTYLMFTMPGGIVSTDYDQPITVAMTGRAKVQTTVYELLEKGIAYANEHKNTKLGDLYAAIYNYGQEAANVFAGKQNARKYDIPYHGSYSGAPSCTAELSGYSFFGSSLTLGDLVSLNYYVKLPAGITLSDLTILVTDQDGNALETSKITTTMLSGSPDYDGAISLKLNINQMKNVYTVQIKQGECVAATCSNSIAYACNYFVEQNNAYAPVADALLAYIERAHDYFLDKDH